MTLPYDRSHTATQAYRDGWDRLFGQPQTEAACTCGCPDNHHQSCLKSVTLLEQKYAAAVADALEGETA